MVFEMGVWGFNNFPSLPCAEALVPEEAKRSEEGVPHTACLACKKQGGKEGRGHGGAEKGAGGVGRLVPLSK